MARRQRISGRVLQATIIELAHMYGWRVAHWPSVRITGRGGGSYYATPLAADTKGFPDLVLVRRNDRTMFVEIKGDGDKIRPDQQQWISDIASTGVEMYVWTPRDLDAGVIQEMLQIDRPPPPPRPEVFKPPGRTM